MPIPELSSDGLLPPGLHPATIDEVVAVFCSRTATRRSLEGPLLDLVAVARDAAAVALYLNGSFVSDKSDPGDIDAVIVLPNNFDPMGGAARRLRRLHQTYGFDIERVRVGDTEHLAYLLRDFFAHDRTGRTRGLIEVIL